MQGEKAEQQWCAAAATSCGGMVGSWPVPVVSADDRAADVEHVLDCAAAVAAAAADLDSQLAQAVAAAVA